MIPTNKKIGVIFKARDFVGSDLERRKMHFENELSTLNNLGFLAEELDLRNYFGNKDVSKINGYLKHFEMVK